MGGRDAAVVCGVARTHVLLLEGVSFPRGIFPAWHLLLEGDKLGALVLACHVRRVHSPCCAAPCRRVIPRNGAAEADPGAQGG